MGAWSHQPFGNDDALDLVDEMMREGAMPLGAAFQIAVDLEYLEAPEASQAVAAAAFVAAALGSAVEVPDDLKPLLPQCRIDAEKLRGIAQHALAKVRDNSELAELWAESEEFEQWQATLDLISSGLA
jgi:hypothetical protein